MATTKAPKAEKVKVDPKSKGTLIGQEKKAKAVVSLETDVYTQKGTKSGSFMLPENVFGVKWNADMVHQVVTSMNSTARQNIAHAKDRSEVRGGGKKPWKQKGTGRARHGSTRSPIWVGGGAAHGPRNDKNFDRKVNKKMKAKALYAILSAKYREGKILFIDSLSLESAKTKDAKMVISNLAKISGYSELASKKRNAAYVMTPNKAVEVERGFANFGNFEVEEMRNINPVDLMKYKYVVIANPETSIAQISNKLSNKLSNNLANNLANKLASKVAAK